MKKNLIGTAVGGAVTLGTCAPGAAICQVDTSSDGGKFMSNATRIVSWVGGD